MNFAFGDEILSVQWWFPEKLSFIIEFGPTPTNINWNAEI